MIPSNDASESAKPLIVWICLFLLVSTITVYWQVQDFEFVNFDDDLYVTKNTNVQNGLNLESITWAFTTPYYAFWIPITYISHIIDFQLFGFDPQGHHLVNLLIHIASSLLLFLLFLRMTGSIWPSCFVATLFALHPFNVESVAWVSERKNVLSTFFWILTLHSYVHYIKKPGIFRYGLTALLLTIGLLAKPMLVTLPFVFLLLDFWPLNRCANFSSIDDRFKKVKLSKLISEKSLFFVIIAIFCVTTYLVQQSGGALQGMEINSLQSRLSNAVVSYGTYLGKTFWPSGFSVMYPHPGNNIPVFKLIISAMLLFGITYFSVKFIKKIPYLALGWFWFLGVLVPVIQIVQSGAPSMADRYAYVPTIGIFIVVAWGLRDFLDRMGYVKLVPMFYALILTPLIFVTWFQVGHWKNSVTLFKHALSVTDDQFPGLATVYNNLGQGLIHKKLYEEAIPQFKKAIEVNPNFIMSHNNLGVALIDLNRRQEATTHFLKAVEINPNYFEAHYNLGNNFNKLKRQEDAIEHFQEAIKIEPDNLNAHNYLGSILFGLNRFDTAMKHFRHAERINPKSPIVHNYIGKVLFELKRYDEAIEQFQQVTEIKVDFAEAYINLASALADTGRLKESIVNYKKAIKLEENNVEAYLNLGITLTQAGRFEEAIDVYEKALEIDPDLFRVHSNLATLFLNSRKDVSNAIKHFKKAIVIKPDYAKAQNNLGGVLAQQGKYEEAIVHFEKAISIDPDYFEAKKYLELSRKLIENNNIQASGSDK